jgi:hypothetical protein
MKFKSATLKTNAGFIPRCAAAKRCPVRGEDQLAFGSADDWWRSRSLSR